MMLFLILLQGFDDPGADREALPRVAPGFVVEVFAREPVVRNPAALAFDGRGRLFVGGGPQYRHPKPDTPGDSIVLLPEGKVFASGFNSIQSLAWKGRDLYVANAPDLTVVRDLDGDDEADEYELLMSGLGTLEHGLHGLSFGPDGKLYLSKGDTPVQPWAPKAFRDLSGLKDEGPGPKLGVFKEGEYRRNWVLPMDGHTEGGVLRCDPDGRNVEIVCRGLRNPWDVGLNPDFEFLGTDNDDVGGDRLFVPFRGAHFGSRHPWSNSWTGTNHLPTVPVSGPTFEGSGVGVAWQGAAQFPASHRGVWLVGDWHRKKIVVVRPQWKGALMQVDRVDELAGGGTSLFRPTDLAMGPDGALYVGGWGVTYEAAWKDKDFVSEGRVFRIRANAPLLDWKSAKHGKPRTSWTDAELVEDLAHPVPSFAVDAQDELIRRRSEVPTSTVAGLWTAARLGRPVKVEGTLPLRLNAVRILGAKADPALLRDPEPRIRLEAALAIADPARLADALADESDRIVFTALWGSLRDRLKPAPLRALLADGRAPVRLGALFGLLERKLLSGEEVRELTKDPDPRVAGTANEWIAKTGFGLEDPKALLAQLARLDHRHVSYELRLPLLRTLASMPLSPSQWEELHRRYYAAWRKADNEVVPEEKGLEVAEALKSLANDPRGVAVVWDALGHPWENVRAAAPFLLPAAEAAARLEKADPLRLPGAVDALGRGAWTPSEKALRLLAEAYAAAKPGFRRAILRALTAAAWPGPGRPAAIEIARKAAADPDPRVHGEVPGLAKALGESIPVTAPPREPATAQSVLAARSAATAALGRELFFEHCTACHRAEGRGRAVGPDLSDLSSRADWKHVVDSILSPSANITEGFRITVLRLKDGRVLEGVAHGESETSLSLFDTAGRETAVRTKDIDARKVSDISLMPAGYEKLLAPEEVASLAAYLLRDGVVLEKQKDRVLVKAGGETVAVYTFDDPKILRPYLAHVRVPGGPQVTRNFPPVQGKDATDHATIHPGLWLGIGDLDGADFWRNKARVSVESIEIDGASIVARSAWMHGKRLVCRDVTRISFRRRPEGLEIRFDTTFSSESAFHFGDQEEMGLGVRLATPLSVAGGGRILDSEGRRNEKEIWGKTAAWVDYGGAIDGRRAGVLLVPHPENFRPSWLHARDYGFVAANPFGRNAFTGGEKSRVDVKAGEGFRLRFSLLAYSGDIDAKSLASALVAP
jgi:putative membrane-bound dehydrogenase-like protein